MTTAGGYRSPIVIQVAGTAQDEEGQPVEGWTEVCRPWANIKHPSGIEAVRADAQASIVKASIRIRYRQGIRAGMRVVHGTTVYSIKVVLPDEVHREHVDLVCESAT